MTGINNYVKIFGVILACCSVPAWSLVFSVDDFSGQLGANSQDSLNLNSAWGDSLYISIEGTRLAETFALSWLNDGNGDNGISAANPVISLDTGRSFQLSYVSWDYQHSFSGATIGQYTAPPADVVKRSINFTPLGVSFSDAVIIAGNENPPDTASIFYSGSNFVPAPSYLNFKAWEDSYAAYWTTLKFSGSLRRTSDEDAVGKSGNNFGVYVTPAAPMVLPYYGTLAMDVIPGSNANTTVLAYDISIGPGRGSLRWESLNGATTDSVIFNSITSANFMEDFAISADSAGNSMVVWREGNILYGTAYASDKTLLLPVTQITPSNIYQQNVPFHTYKQYSVADVSQNNFIVTYSIAGSIYINTIDLTGPSVGTQMEITPGCNQCYFPNIDISQNYAVVNWYGNSQGGASRVEGAMFEITSGNLSIASRQDILFSSEEVTYNVGGGWQPWHNYRVPALGVNDDGDVLVAYDNQFGARITGWSNSFYYYDSAYFISSIQNLGNSSLGLPFVSGLDSAQIYFIDFNADSLASLSLAFNADSNFSSDLDIFQNISEYDSLSNPIYTSDAYFKYRIHLPSIGVNKLLSSYADGLSLSYNVKPRTAQIDSIQILPNGLAQAYDSNSNYSAVIRRDSIRLVLSIFDLDGDSSVIFSQTLDSSWEVAGSYLGNGQSRAEFILPLQEGNSRQIQYEFLARDSRNWESSSTGINIDYQNTSPQFQTYFIRPREFQGQEYDTSLVADGDLLSVFARDTQYIAIQYLDSNDVSLQIKFFENGNLLEDSAVAPVGQGLFILSRDSESGPINYRILVNDSEDSVSLSFDVEFRNPNPVAALWAEYTDDFVLRTRDSVELSNGTAFDFYARDSIKFYLSISDTNDLEHHVVYSIDDSVLLDTNMLRNEIAEIFYSSSNIKIDASHKLEISDSDTTIVLDWPNSYLNIPPSLSGTIAYHSGQLINGKFSAYSGDTLQTVFREDSSYIFNQSDSISLEIAIEDPFDSSFNVRFVFLSDTSNLSVLAKGDGLSFNFPVNIAPGAREELEILIEDSDSLFSESIFLIANGAPGWDSLSSYFGNEQVDKISYSQASDINIAPGLVNQLNLFLKPSENLVPDSIRISWYFYERGADCPVGQMLCYQLADSATGNSFEKLIPPNLDVAALFLEDNYGYIYVDTIAFQFPYLDTSDNVNAEFAGQLVKLMQDSIFVIGSEKIVRENAVEVFNTGSGTLEIRSSKTASNSQNWMSYSLSWVDPDLGAQNLNVTSGTDSNMLSNPARIFPDNKLDISFAFSAENLKGDGVLQDTLLLITNDFQNPVLRIPFSFHHVDLPTVDVNYRKINLQATSKKSASAASKPPRSRDEILISFSEPVAWSSLNSQTVKIYSYYDSLKVDSIAPIPSAYPDYFRPYYFRPQAGAQVDSLVDSVAFSPQYVTVSDSFNVKPLSGQFIIGDEIHVNLSNSIVDSVGNPLDFRLRKILTTPGSEDSTVSLNLAAQPLQIVSTYPEQNSRDADPQKPIEIHFNQPLSYFYYHDSLGGNVTSIDTANFLSDTNYTVFITSSENNNQAYQIKYLRLINDDSTLLIKTQPNFFSRDSVSLTLFSNLGVGQGVTLDGNADGLGRYWYDPQNTSDNFVLNFLTKKVDFYIYPNPFRWSEPSHREKGSMTFKNLTSLKGVSAGSRLSFRIYTMNGDLVYNSSEKGEDFRFSADVLPVWDWNVKNSSENNVGTGVYIYSIFQNSKKLLKKGKLAVIQ